MKSNSKFYFPFKLPTSISNPVYILGGLKNVGCLDMIMCL